MPIRLPLNPALASLPVYQPGRPIDEVARGLGLPLADIIKLASNENPLGPSPAALAAMEKTLQHLHRYPDGNSHYLKLNLAGTLGLEPRHLILGNGSNEIIEFVGHALLGPATEIVVSQYCFAIYPIVAHMFGASVITVPARDFGHDLEAMAQAITPGTQVVFVANPNNPTGTLAEPDAVRRLVAAVPPEVSPNDLTRVTYKGSITINGISLTVANINKANNTITIWIIPETIRRTTFGLEGLLSTYYETVNIEFDIHDYNREVRDHSYFMRLAIQEGELGRATTPPYPWVGCIVVKDGNIIGKGHHEQAGRDHAEVLAINNCFNSPMSSTVYCTLEPCVSFNTKRTQSCAEYLIQFNIETVVVGIIDPDVRVGGLGIKKLRDAGIKVLFIEDIDRKVYEEVRFSLRREHRPVCATGA